jgi:uncharacterized damage-inducible protein DinB
MNLINENQTYSVLLCMHVRSMIRSLQQMSEEHWDWRPDQAAPTARILATHTYQWLVCDRQHINEPDALKHSDVPALPHNKEEACACLTEEIDRWEKMIQELSADDLSSPRSQFNGYSMNVRGFIAHMIQNCIYKNGQLSTLYFALGYDGTEPYDAPFPNPIYAELRAGWPSGS